MPELVQLGKEFGEQDLAIVGINFDDSLDKAKAAVEKHGQTWPQVFALDAAKGDAELWEQVADIAGLPRILVLDRNGVLRHDTRARGLRELVKALVEEGR